jgi:hypothetical protein
MKELLLLALIFTGLQSCAPSKIENVEQMNSNTTEISTLEGDIELLKAEIQKQNEAIKKQQEENKANNIPVVSNDPDYNRLKANVDELRSDLIRMIQQLEKKLDQRLKTLESNYKNFKKTLNQIDNNYVSLADFESLRIDIENDLARKESLLNHLKDTSINQIEIQGLNQQILEIKNTQTNVKTEYQNYFKTAISAWNKKFMEYAQKENNTQSKQLKLFVKAEIERVKISIESIENKIAAMDVEIDDLMNEDSTPQIVSNYNQQLKEYKALIAQNNQLLKDIKEQTEVLEQPNLYSDIMDKQFAPCVNDGGLKETPLCFTFGALITRLGGIFVDPTNFPNTIKGFLSYLTLSGISINSPFENYNAYLIPELNNVEKLKSCHEGKRINLLPPQGLWPRGVLLSLILQNIEKDLLRQKELGFVRNNAAPIRGISSWYRTKCYQSKLNKNSPDSDHILASAFDLSFNGQSSEDTFEFYREYVLNHIWKNDTFEVVHPLKSSNLTFAIGIGLGHGSHGKGMLHLGIGSQVNTPNKRRDWGYEDNDGNDYTDLLSNEE